MKINLFNPGRERPEMYDLQVGKRWELVPSIRIGVSWPDAGKAGYYVVVGQRHVPKEWESDTRDESLRLFAFNEGQASTMSDLCEKMLELCKMWRIKTICHGDEPGEKSFSSQLSSYLWKHEKDVIQVPTVWKTGRSKDLDFLVQLVRNFITEKRLSFYSEKTPLVFEKLRSTDKESGFIKIPEIKALAHVVDDFDRSPWTQPEKVKPMSPEKLRAGLWGRA